MLKKIQMITQNVLFPSYCVLCSQALPFSFPVCRKCIKSLPFIENACLRCGHPLSQNAFCGHCLKRPPHFDSTISCFVYTSPIRELLYRFKLGSSLYLAPLFARFMAHHIQKNTLGQNARPEILLPMPAHPKRIRARGFSPSLEITSYLSRFLHIPMDRRIAKRTIHTPPQSELPFKERKKNVMNVFKVNRLSRTSIAIVDDVMTTGATAQSLAKTLKKAGAKRVSVWCLARTTLDNLYT